MSSDARMSGNLQMSREQMLDFGQKALELVLERTERRAGENALEGEFRQLLEDQLLEDPPEGGRPAAEVIECAAREAAGHPERATVYVSDRSHSALYRAAFIVGIRRECIRMIGGGHRLRPALPAAA